MSGAARRRRIRGRRLQEYRAAWFRLHPLCAECERNGKVRLATQLDHIVALDNGGTDFDQPGMAVAVYAGTPQEALARRLLPKAKLIEQLAQLIADKKLPIDRKSVV